jgi:hypothetical protein
MNGIRGGEQRKIKEKYEINNPFLSTPFRIGGRGSKQLSMALEQSSLEKRKGNQEKEEFSYVYCLGNHSCFGKIFKYVESGIIIQPMSAVEGDHELFTLWKGHLWMVKKDKIHPVRVRMKEKSLSFDD